MTPRNFDGRSIEAIKQQHFSLAQRRVETRYHLDVATDMVLNAEDYDPNAWNDVDVLAARLNYIDGVVDALLWAGGSNSSPYTENQPFTVALRRLQRRMARNALPPAAEYREAIKASRKLSDEITRLHDELEALRVRLFEAEFARV